jgi:hypothetical protein
MKSFTHHYSTIRNKIIDIIELIGDKEEIKVYLWVNLYDKVKIPVQDKLDLIRSYPILEKLSDYEHLTNTDRKNEVGSQNH